MVMGRSSGDFRQAVAYTSLELRWACVREVGLAVLVYSYDVGRKQTVAHSLGPMTRLG